MEDRFGILAFLATMPSRKVYLALRVASVVTGLLIALPTVYLSFNAMRRLLRGAMSIDRIPPWPLVVAVLMCHAFLLIASHEWRFIRKWYPRSLFVMIALSVFTIWLTLMLMSGFWFVGPFWGRATSISISIVVTVGSFLGLWTAFIQSNRPNHPDHPPSL